MTIKSINRKGVIKVKKILTHLKWIRNKKVISNLLLNLLSKDQILQKLI